MEEIAPVTGTSTGMGFASSVRLARHGFRALAGMRNRDNNQRFFDYFRIRL